MTNAQINLADLSSDQITELKELLQKNFDKLTVTSTYALSQTEKGAIMQQLGLKKEQELLVTNIVDPSILGGIIVQCEGHYFDLSLRGALQAISESLLL